MSFDFSLDSKAFTAINGGPQFTFSEAVSLLIDCADQDEIDHYWETLSDGGETGQCGWLKDRYRFSWQVCPDDLAELLSDADPSGPDGHSRLCGALTHSLQGANTSGRRPRFHTGRSKLRACSGYGA